jgi:hypothetical protein
MRSSGVTAVATTLFFLAGPLACGLDSQGLLATDGGIPPSTSPGDDGTVSDEEAGVTGTPGPDAGKSGDARAPSPPDAAAPVRADSGSASAQDASIDAPLSCIGCVNQKCPTQVAACQAGSACLAYRDCDVTCSSKGGQGSSNCSSVCQAKYPAGETAFASLTLCAVGCGAGCITAIAVGIP